MAKYRVYCDVTNVQGWQCWSVEAANNDEAMQKIGKGEGEFDSEELEVRSFDIVSAELAND